MTPDINNLPQLELLASFNSFDELSDIDLKSNIPVQPKFKYYTTQDFVNNEAIIINCTSSKCFSGLHTNIRSLNSNFDNFTQMLTELNHDFSVIGLTETKSVASRSQFININIPGYKFDSQPNLSNAGGIVFFCS